MNNGEIQLVGDASAFHAAQRPHASAMVFGERDTTYAELDNQALQVAHGLAAAGIQLQQRIAYLGKNSDLYFQLLFGAAKAGVVLVVVNWRLTAPEIETILTDSQSRWVFVEPEFLSAMQAARSHCPSLQRLTVMTAGDAPDSFVGWRNQYPSVFTAPEIDPGAVVLQMYTSGTTGKPKGAMLTHAALMCQRQSEAQDPAWEPWSEQDAVLVAMPVFHIGGTGWAFIGFYNGSRNIIHATPVADAILADIETYRISRMFIVPAVLSLLVDLHAGKPRDLSSVRTIVYGASPISEALLSRALRILSCGFIQQYGMTEATGAVTCLPAADHSVEGGPRMRSCGRALPGVGIEIRDTLGKPVAAGEPGEICIKSAALMKGYWNMPEATAETMQDGWYRSGDVGYLDQDGYLYLLDRTKDMIISGGENIYPSEVEAAISAHPLVADVAVIGVPDIRWGEAVKAVVVRRDVSLDESGLISYLRTCLAGYKIPKSVDFVDTLPRNPSGKILKRELRKPYWQEQQRAIS